MPAVKEPIEGTSRKMLALHIVLVYGCLAITLQIYQTTLNPGLPILLGGGLTALWLGVRSFRGTGSYYHHACDLAILLGFAMALSSKSSLDSYLSQRSLATYVGALGFVLACQCSIKSSQDWRFLARAFVVFCTAVCITAWPPVLAKALESGALPLLKGPFVNQDTFAVVPMLGLALGLGLLEKGQSVWRVSLVAMLAFLFVTLVVTGCRAAMVGFAVAFLVFAALLVTNRKSHIKRTKGLLALPLLIIVLLFPLSGFGIPILTKWTREITTVGTEGEGIRAELFANGWKAVAAHPLLGSGPGTFGLSYQAVRPPEHEYHYINIAHNDHLEIAVEGGLIGFALWIAILVTLFRSLYGNVVHGRRPVEAAGALAVVIAPVVFTMFNFILAERPALWLQFLAFGLAMSFPTSRGTSEESRMARYGLAAPLAILAVWSMHFGITSMKADGLVVAADRYRSELRLEEAARDLNAAIGLQPGRAAVLQKRAEIAGQLAAFTDEPKYYEAELYFLQKASRASPQNIAIMLQIADHYAAEQNFKKEQQVLEKASLAAPSNPVVDERHAASLIHCGRLKEAADIIKSIAQREGGRYLAQLSALSIAMEGQTAGQGATFAKSMIGWKPDRHAKAYFELLLRQCETEEKWSLQIELLKALKNQDPEGSLCLDVQMASAVGRSQDEKAELAILEKAMAQLQSANPACAKDLVLRWVELSRRENRVPELVARLKNLVEKDPNVPWLRVCLSDLLLSQKETLAAITLVREGLDQRQYSPELLLQMGKLYEASGNRDLALNYYREASRVDNKMPEAAEGVRRLQKR